MNLIVYRKNWGDGHKSTSKYIFNGGCIDCENKITFNDPTTKEWLYNLKLLNIPGNKNPNMTNKKILEGILLDKAKEDVVVKIANENDDIKIEFDTYKKLFQNKIPNILDYYCYFECNDNLKSTPNDGSLCIGKGNKLKVLIMKFVKFFDLKDYDWKLSDKEIIKYLFKHAFLTYIMAFIKTGFTHGDFHFKNILLEKSTKKSIKYYINNNIYVIPIEKYEIKIMDFEMSKFNYDFLQLYRDLRLSFITKICCDNFGSIFDINTFGKINNIAILKNKFDNIKDDWEKEPIKNNEISIKYAMKLLEKTPLYDSSLTLLDNL